MTDVQASQTLANGIPIANKYGNYGTPPSAASLPFDRQFTMIVGEPGKGKTSLWLGHPGALILNVDLRMVPTPEINVGEVVPPPAARFMPGLGDDGNWHIATPAGSRRVSKVTWDDMRKVRDSLIQDKVAGKPVPTTIVLDTLTTAWPLVEDWVAENAVALKLSTKAVEGVFKALDGRSAIPAVWDEFVDFGVSLRAAGFGVCYIAHIGNKFVQIGENANNRVLEFYVASKLFNRLSARMDHILGVITKDEIIKVKRTGKIMLAGKEIDDPGEDAKTITKHYLVYESVPELQGICKVTIALKDPWEIPKVNSWQAFEKMYNECPKYTRKLEPSPVS